MMSKEKQEFHMSIGAPSIFMLFVVLVMLILATLASLRAHSYYESTLRQMNLTKQYYQAQSHLLTVYEQLEPKDIEQQLKSKNIHYIYQNQIYYLRISSLPGRELDSIVIRILNNHQQIALDKLTIFKETTVFLKHITTLEAGLFIVSGATGSGKSTTLYTVLKEILLHENKNVISIEDPIEIHLDECLQIELNEKLGITYHDTLKQILRHDPDVIMIGEVRDELTAKIAITCALTGHLVLTTIHASSALLSLKRLMNLGVHQIDICDVVIGAMSQRMKYDSQKEQVIVLSELMKKGEIKDYFEKQKISYLTFDKAAKQLIKQGFDQNLFIGDMANE